MAEGNPAGPFHPGTAFDPSIDPDSLPELSENASEEERNFRAWLDEAHAKWVEEQEAGASEPETPDQRVEREAEAHSEAVAAKEERTGESHPENASSKGSKAKAKS